MAVVIVEVSDGVALVRLSRPKKLNTLNLEVLTQLAVAFENIAVDECVQCVILTGDGGNFSAGIDLQSAADVFNGPLFRDYMTKGESTSDPLYWMERLPQPIIAAVDGFAITGGFELVLACDMVVATPRAKFQDTHAKFGIAPFWGLSQRLPSLVGVNRARQFSLSATAIDAQTAEKWGLVNMIADDAVAGARELAAQIARNPAAAVQNYKKTINRGLDAQERQGRRAEFDNALKFYSSEHFKSMVAMMAQSLKGKSKL